MITCSELAGQIFSRLSKYEESEGINEKGFGTISEKQYKFMVKLASKDPKITIFDDGDKLFKKLEGMAQVGKTKVIPFAAYEYRAPQGSRYAVYSDIYANWPFEPPCPSMLLPDITEHYGADWYPNAQEENVSASEYFKRIAECRSKNHWFRPNGFSPINKIEHDTLVSLWFTNPGDCVACDMDFEDGIGSLMLNDVKLAGCGKKVSIYMMYSFREEDSMAFPFLYSSGHDKL